MKIKHIKLSVLVIAILVAFGGCRKEGSFLDKAESGGMSESVAFSTYLNTNGFLAGIYQGLFHDEWMPLYGFSYGNVTDEAYCPYPQNDASVIFRNGSLSSTSNPLDRWGALYALIRKTHIFLRNIDNVPSETTKQGDELKRMKGEAYFIRAYCYFELFKRYGGVPVIDYVMEVTDDFNVPRNTAEEVVAFIEENCNLAADILPPTYTSSDLGRATKGAALMLKSRALLYLASPLHNKGNEVGRWTKAADAAKAVIDLGLYSLNNNYVNLFHTRFSNEVIFQSTVNFNSNGGGWNDWQQQNTIQREWGWANNQPSHNLVEAYEMKNGLPITDPASGYNSLDPYKDRDPRLGLTIYHNGSIWKERNDEPRIETFVGGIDGIYNGPDGGPQKYSYTQTGYYLGNKMLDPNGDMQPWPGHVGSNYWIFMRYGEALLNYAEAQNEVLAAPDQTVYKAINDIRGRVGIGMPDLPAGLSKDQMRARIRHERRIELAFENFRFWDVRRWGIGESVFKTIYGMRITKKNDASLSYEKFQLESRVYRPAFDLFPIPQSEMNRNTALVQNAGYN
ncbi:RagB/SusD family nutrient uptake outer membrane protein [Chitinophaga sp. MM2321]|uniref:RagB/SusD family nutrient uptake outer membrane protein n=1 Tax=Chitinophaga sp. MM2321 TaxID=3137178 RepID=UPI0032D58D29